MRSAEFIWRCNGSGGDPVIDFEPVNMSTSDSKDASITEAFGESGER